LREQGESIFDIFWIRTKESPGGEKRSRAPGFSVVFGAPLGKRGGAGGFDHCLPWAICKTPAEGPKKKGHPPTPPQVSKKKREPR